MKPEFWLDAWRTGRRGFHKPEPHPDLIANAHRFSPGSILVPLCGATHDLGWLAANGWTAIGVELSPLAIEELAERYGLTQDGDWWTGERMRVWCGDFFEVPDLGPLAGIWDRAALVAMHPDQRGAYVAKQRRLLGDGTLLLNVLDYDKSKMEGPPWAVSLADTEALWGELELLDSTTSPAQGRFEVLSTMTRHLLVGQPGANKNG